MREQLAGTRIALVGPLPPPSGGMANQTRQLANLLKEEGLAVELIQVNPAYRPAWVANVPRLRALFRLFGYLGALFRGLKRADLCHVMANSGWSWHLYAAPAVWVARLRGVPVVVNYRGGEAEAFFSRSIRLVAPTLKMTAEIVVPSGFLEEVFGRRGLATRIVPNIVALDRFFPPAASGLGELRGDAPHIVVTRNLEPIYDIATAVDAFKRVKTEFPGATMTVAGSGPERSVLERLVNDHGLSDSIRFSGRLDNDQVAQLYRSADAMLNPSLVDNMPISILEAFASGVPVVSTRVGGVPYLVEQGVTGLLVPPGDARAMASALTQLLRDRELRRRFAEKGLEQVDRYTWPQVREQLAAVYSSALISRR